jgi:1-acyl-sn-glycerol-3-phosphate acyltransferase
VCNHISFMDPLIIMGCVRRPVRFVMYYKIFATPVVKYVFRAAKAIPIAGAKEDAAIMEHAFATVDKELDDGNIVCIFPEGGITRDGAIQRFRPGMERILGQRPVPVVPLALRGLWGSLFSRRDSTLGRMRLPRRFWSKIELVAGPAVPPAEANAALRRSSPIATIRRQSGKPPAQHDQRDHRQPHDQHAAYQHHRVVERNERRTRGVGWLIRFRGNVGRDAGPRGRV